MPVSAPSRVGRGGTGGNSAQPGGLRCVEHGVHQGHEIGGGVTVSGLIGLLGQSDEAVGKQHRADISEGLLMNCCHSISPVVRTFLRPIERMRAGPFSEVNAFASAATRKREASGSAGVRVASSWATRADGVRPCLVAMPSRAAQNSGSRATLVRWPDRVKLRLLSMLSVDVQGAWHRGRVGRQCIKWLGTGAESFWPGLRGACDFVDD